jgi:hypothetical protein
MGCSGTCSPLEGDAAVRKLYSQRQREAEEGARSDYLYDDVPEPFRWQLWYAMEKSFSALTPRDPSEAIERGVFQVDPRAVGLHRVQQELREAYGKPSLSGASWYRDPEKDLLQFLLECEARLVLDLAEVWLAVLSGLARRFRPDAPAASVSRWQSELNALLRSHRIGYEFVDGAPVRIDSAFLHVEVVKEAIALMHAEGFAAPLEEFARAVEHRDEGRPEDAITNANSAFESTMKVVFDREGIPYDPKATAKVLIQTLYDRGFLLPELEGLTNNLRAFLECSLPMLRSRHGAHGRGSLPRAIEESYATFALHLAGAFIVFLIQRHRERTARP